MEQLKCVKCGGEMEKGFSIDNAYIGWFQLRWVTKMGIFSGENEKKIDTYRCKSCGYLESYANNLETPIVKLVNREDDK